MDISSARTSLSECSSDVYALKGVMQALLSEELMLIEKIKSSQLLVDNKPNVMAVLDELNQRTQARTKSVYEDLLTTLLHEVKPDDPENHSVVLQTEIKKSKVSLDVGVKTAQGFVRNAYQDKGRSVENIIAMGLRFISVSRTSNRRFIVMDEADNNLRQEYIPAFAKIMAQLARQIGMQVIYISHHPASCFEGHARIIGFERVNGRVSADVISEPAGIDELQPAGIRYIRLVNTKQHENTFIELSPGVNIITADIDVGKSTLAQAIEAVAQNEGREGLIRDGEPSLMVEIGLENEMTLCWEYSRKGSRKTKYTLRDSSGAVCNESADGQYVPEWLHDYLGMEKKHDFDIHISDSHNSSFILDKKISSFKRADLLSLGRESADVQKMIRIYAERMDKAVRLLNESKKRLDLVQRKLAVVGSITAVDESIITLGKTLDEIDKHKEKLNSIGKYAGKLASASERCRQLSEITQIEYSSNIELQAGAGRLESLINELCVMKEKTQVMEQILSVNIKPAPSYVSPEPIAKIGASIDKLFKLKSRLEEVATLELPSKPELRQSERCLELANKIKANSDRLEILVIPDVSLLTKPNYRSPDNIALVGNKIGVASKHVAELSSRLENDRLAHHQCLNEKEILITEIGGKCPLCEQIMPKVGP